MFTVNENRCIVPDGAISNYITSKENQERFLDNIFSEFPDVTKPYHVNELLRRSKRDKPVIVQVPKNMTLTEAVRSGKHKIYALTFDQLEGIWGSISNESQIEHQGWVSYADEIKVSKRIYDKWVHIGKPKNPFDFDFLVKWFSRINLESKRNKYFFLRYSALRTNYYSCSNPNRFDLYVCDESPEKENVSTVVKEEISRILYNSYHYQMECENIFRDTFVTERAYPYHYDNHDDNHNHLISLLSGYGFIDDRDKRRNDYICRLSYSFYPCARLILCLCCDRYTSGFSNVELSYARSQQDIENVIGMDLLDFLKKTISESKCVLDFPYAKNCSAEVAFCYVNGLHECHGVKYNIHAIDKRQFDTNIRRIYWKLSYKWLKKEYESYNNFCKRFKGFGETFTEKLKDAGYVFYNDRYVKNYIENIFKLFCIFDVSGFAPDTNISFSIYHKSYLSYIDAKTEEWLVSPERTTNVNSNYRAAKEFVSFGGKYDIDPNYEASFIDAETIQSNFKDFLTDFAKTSFQYKKRYSLIKELLNVSLIPVFDGTRCSIFDIKEAREIKCIVDFAKGEI